MAELKTKMTEASVDDFLNGLSNEQTRNDCIEIIGLMRQATQEEPKMWGASIIGFGNVHLKYASGRELDWMRVGFSPRKKSLVFYLPVNIDAHTDLLEKLGKHTRGVGCLYIKTLKDVDTSVLAELIQQSIRSASDGEP